MILTVLCGVYEFRDSHKVIGDAMFKHYMGGYTLKCTHKKKRKTLFSLFHVSLAFLV